MNNQVKFIIKLVKEFKKNELYFLSNELTYKMVLASFPLMIFLLNIFVMFNINREAIYTVGSGTIPDEVVKMFVNFLDGLNNATNQDNITGTLSWTLIITVSSAGSGFRSIIRGINKTYKVKEKRRFVVKWALAVFLVIQFVGIIIIASISLVFGDILIELINNYGLFPNFSIGLLKALIYFFTVAIMLIDVMFIYKISVEHSIKFMSTLPGATVTIIFWIISSKVFNIYVNNFSNYNNIYGGIGSLFIFIFWINLIAFFLLLGSQINALLESINKNV